MNKILLLLTILFSLSFTAQTDKELDLIADYTCECLSKKKMKKNDLDRLELELGLCVMEGASKASLNLTYTDEESMTKLGEQVGLRMVGSCEAFIDLIGVMMDKNPDGMMELMNEKDVVVNNHFRGELSKINKDQFITLELKADDGKIETFYWLEYFEGANILKDNSTFLMNKKINIEYKEVEYYFPEYEEYLKVKVITKLLEK